MNNFFDSDIVQKELDDINQLQEDICGSIMSFGAMDIDTKLEHVEKLQVLLEKQRVMYTRLSLSDHPKAVEMKENLQKSVVMMGFPPHTDIQVLFNTMEETIVELKRYLD